MEHFIYKVLCVWTWTSLSEVLGVPLLGPHLMSFGSLTPVWPGPTFPDVPTIPLHFGLPAPRGTVFDGPDPGLNAAIITVPRESCPSGYRRDINDDCRLKFGYGPNPFFSFTPENFKGSIQFYMGLQIGRPSHPRRRGRFRGRPRPPHNSQAPSPKKTNPVDDDDD